MRAVCGVFRVAERCFSLGSILAAAASPAHAALEFEPCLLFCGRRIPLGLPFLVESFVDC